MANSTPHTQTRTAPPTTGSSTVTATSPTQPALRLTAVSGTLRLRAEPAQERHIQWAEDVIDNEGMGKKSSKVCCIYHGPREFGESSSESSSDSSSSSSDDDSDSEPDNSTARPAGGASRGQLRGRRPHGHEHAHEHEHGDECHHGGEGSGTNSKKMRKQRRKPSPNAYEKMPKVQK